LAPCTLLQECLATAPITAPFLWKIAMLRLQQTSIGTATSKTVWMSALRSHLVWTMTPLETLLDAELTTLVLLHLTQLCTALTPHLTEEVCAETTVMLTAQSEDSTATQPMVGHLRDLLTYGILVLQDATKSAALFT
jgi:hypothetical protein